jgi:hypothetical protein
MQDAIDVGLSEKLRGDRRVRAASKQAGSLLGGHRGEQFPLARAEGSGGAHDFLRELEQIPRSPGIVREQMAQVRLAVGLWRSDFEMLNEHAKRRGMARGRLRRQDRVKSPLF